MGHNTYGFDQLPLLHEWPLVLNIIAGGPCLDLIAKPLQLLDLSLKVVLELLLLRGICRLFYLLVD